MYRIAFCNGLIHLNQNEKNVLITDLFPYHFSLQLTHTESVAGSVIPLRSQNLALSKGHMNRVVGSEQ